MVSHKLVVKDDPMRTHHWLTAFLSGMMVLTVCWKASAQTPPVEATGQAAYSPIQFDAPAEAGYLPYPAISPYDHVFDETYEENGMWLRNFTNVTQNRYSFTAEALLSHFKAPGNAKAGNPHVNAGTFFFDGDNAINNSQTGPVVPSPDWYPAATNNKDVFMSRGTGLVGAPGGPGVRLTFRIETPDEQFLELSGFGIFNNEAHNSIGRPIFRTGPRGRLPDAVDYKLGLGTKFTDQPFGPLNGPLSNRWAVDHVNENVISYLMPGVAVNDGTPDGTVIRADHYYYQFMKGNAYGAGFTWGHAPIHKIGAFAFQPTFGVRYINVSEHYGLRIHDSGLDYSFVNDPTDPLYGTIDTVTLTGLAPFRQFLDSYTKTNLGGPEVGLSYKAGGDGLSFLGSTKFGLLGAQERLTVTAKGFGQQYLINQNPVAVQYLNPFYNRNKFTSRTVQHSFVTPSFQQSVTTRSHLLSYVPLVRNIRAFREAEFTAGYTIFMLFQLSRPNESIIWNANTGVNQNGNGTLLTPKEAKKLAPEPMTNRSVWWMSNFNLGVNWRF